MKLFVDTAKVEDIQKANDMGVIKQMTKHPLTDAGIAKFQADYQAVFGE